MKAGTVVIAEFIGVQTTKRRPALVVSSEVYHNERPDMILAVITSQILKSKAETDYILQDWQSANLNKESAVRMFLFTLPQNSVKKIGQISEKDRKNVQAKLKLSIEV